MMLDTTDRILVALFCLCRDTRPVDAATLGQLTGQSPTCAATALVALERAGLVDASRARLTMLGLARAAQLQARTDAGSGGLALKPAAISSAARTRIKPPVAARPAAHARSADAQEPLLQHVAGAGIGQ